MRVKICGIQTIEAAQSAVHAGADWIGFVFAPSKRQVSLQQAYSIICNLPSTVQTVGVFVNETVEAMNHYAREIGLNYIQLHGTETPNTAKKLKTNIIKAFPSNEIDGVDVVKYPCDYILVDAPRATYAGGNGVTFDWQQLKQPLPKHKLMIAGGLHAENVSDAICQLQPAAVDVSSGVETNGRKDINKINQFIQIVKKEGKNEL
ncbi:N-(5'-phosphoribosyl)anthranilate isomerase [Virgibacillus dokdonensis]|uniref:N-(5'-phosphoribosyl)anthranilate isomerase n=1 Tax=Virgibacillus dokdonensis TaxID=302167 RepID=A0A3E0WIP7_9BACI|nr:phosphoribosylanthranilate isomerase [Virgibacillus dokdonensis]RFA31987.1 N-(5'-phosphoribosyl)anthranilate isomerase [Virgibacillus dokdonensis]